MIPYTEGVGVFDCGRGRGDISIFSVYEEGLGGKLMLHYPIRLSELSQPQLNDNLTSTVVGG